MEAYERAAAMPWSLAYRPISTMFFWAVSPVRPTLLLNFACRFETSQFAEAIPHKGPESDRDLLGSGSPSTGLEESQKGRSFDRQCSAQTTSLHV